MQANLLTLQTLCLSAMKPNQSKLSLQNTVDFLEKAQKSLPPKLSQVTGDRPILKGSEEDGEQLLKKIMDDLNENTDFPESRELLTQEIERWKQRRQEKEREKERLEQWKAGAVEPRIATAPEK